MSLRERINKVKEVKKALNTIKNKIKANKKLNSWQKLIALSDINNKYNGRQINRRELIQKGFNLGNGDGSLRANSDIHKLFIVAKQKYKNRISSFQIMGINFGEIEHISNYIPGRIIKKYKKMPCVITGTKSDIEIDHKIGCKKYMKEDDPRLNCEEYYQSLSKSMNNLKREKCKYCGVYKIRPLPLTGAILPYTSGNKNLNVIDGEKIKYDNNPCKGCYWFDPVAFEKEQEVIMKLLIEKNIQIQTIIDEVNNGLTIEEILKKHGVK